MLKVSRERLVSDVGAKECFEFKNHFYMRIDDHMDEKVSEFEKESNLVKVIDLMTSKICYINGFIWVQMVEARLSFSALLCDKYSNERSKMSVSFYDLENSHHEELRNLDKGDHFIFENNLYVTTEDKPLLKRHIRCMRLDKYEIVNIPAKALVTLVFYEED